MAGSLALGPDGTIYGFVGGGEEELEGFIRAINPDGTEKWRTREVFTESSPTVAPDGTVYIGLGHEFRGFLALNSDGTEKWFFETSNDISLISGLANDGTVYVGEWDGLFYAFNPDGSIKWSFETPKGHESLISSPAIGADGAIYFGAEDGFHALHPDGTEKWHFVGDIGAVVSSPAIGQDGTVYVGSWNHKLYAFGEGEIAEADKQSTTLFEGSGSVPTCPDGIWDEEEQANPKMCPLDNPNLSEEERKNPEKINHEEVRTNMPYPEEVSEDLHELFDERSFFTRIADWFRGLFGDPEVREMKKKIVLKPDRYEKDFFVQEKPKDVVLESKEVCLMAEEYASGAPILSLPFKLEDYGPKHWGMVPFCADPWNSGNIHGALDFELKPDSKVYAASDGVVEHTAVGQAEGSGEIISVKGEGFFLDYSGLGNIQVKAGDVIKKGDYIANVVQIPHGEYHVHLGIRLDKGPECPIKYMDKEFRDALQQMFAQAHYLRQDEQPCACNCEYLS